MLFCKQPIDFLTVKSKGVYNFFCNVLLPDFVVIYVIRTELDLSFSWSIKRGTKCQLVPLQKPTFGLLLIWQLFSIIKIFALWNHRTHANYTLHQSFEVFFKFLLNLTIQFFFQCTKKNLYGVNTSVSSSANRWIVHTCC